MQRRDAQVAKIWGGARSLFSWHQHPKKRLSIVAEQLESRRLFAAFVASDYSSLVSSINSANGAPDNDTIDLTANIRLTALLPKITSNIAIAGNGAVRTISGDANNSGTNNSGDVRVFFVGSGTVSFTDLVITLGRAEGGAGGNGLAGGGGGGGLGGGLFINGGEVTLANVTFSSNIAVGGTGGTALAFSGNKGAGGAGGGLFGAGGAGAQSGATSGGGGGEGGGYSSSGNSASGTTPGSGGSTEGGDGGTGGTTPGTAIGAAGVAGSDFGGGGGGGAGFNAVSGAGGNGGFGGGGGAGASGGSSNSGGGAGGFAGGGGGSPGGGSGGGVSGGTGGHGGGGGAGLGAGLFIRSGSLVLSTVTFNSNASTGGLGGSDNGGILHSNGSNGEGRGGALYINSGVSAIGAGITYSSNSASTAEPNAHGTISAMSVPSVRLQPSNQSATAGNNVTFTADATGNPIPTVQWQVKVGSAAFTDIAGATSSVLTFTTTADQNGNQYRAVFTNLAGTAASDAATLTVNVSPVITTNPTDQAAPVGGTVTFFAAASGMPTPSVQWQLSTDNGATFSNITGARSTSLSVVVGSTQNGRQYRAVFTNAAGSVTSSSATLFILTSTSAPDLQAASDSGTSDDDNITDAVSPIFGVTSALAAATVELLRDGSVVASRTGPGALTDDNAPTGQHNYTARQTMSGYTTTATGPLNVTIDRAAPSLQVAPTFRFESVSQALIYTFSETVLSSIELSDFSVQNLTTSATIANNVKSSSYDTNSNVLTLHFPGLSNGILPDGNHRSSIAAAAITDVAGNPLPASVFDFFVFAGDANRDRVVDAKDLGALAASWQGSSKTYSQGNFNYDNIVDIKDLYILASKWQQTLLPPPPLSTVIASSQPSTMVRRTPTRIAAEVISDIR